MLADPVLARVPQRGDLRHGGAAFGVGEGGDVAEPRAYRERDGCAHAVAEAGVDDGGQVAGSGQVRFGDRGGQQLGGVQAGQFGGAHGSPQPPGLKAQRPVIAGRQAGRHHVFVPLLAVGRGLGRPDGVQDREVVGVGEGAVPVLGGGHELPVTVQDGGQHGQRLARRGG